VNPSDTKSTLRVRALELADPAGVLLPEGVRERCTAEAGPPDAGAAPAAGDDALTPGEEAFLARRAALIDAQMRRRHPAFSAPPAATEARRWLAVALPALAFGLGFFSYRIAPDQRINLLASPLLGLVAWNLAVYLLLLARRLRPQRGGPAAAGPLTAALAHCMARVQPPLPAGPSGSESERARAAIAANAAAGFLRDWIPLEQPLLLAQAGRLLHACAALVALGATASLILSGIYLEYRAGWESTFLDAGAVRAILSLLLGPASLITGIPIPDGTAFEALRFGPGGGGENAGRWIVLHAATAALYVIAPRMLLMSRSALAARRLRLRYYEPQRSDPYFHRLLQAGRGGGEVAAVLWHGIEPTRELEARVRDVLHERLGGRVSVEFLDPVSYGEESSVPERLTTPRRREHAVAVFSLAATPEEEVQGALLRQLAACGPPGREPLALLDAAPLERFAADAGFRARYEERLRAWQRFVDRCHAQHIVLAPAPVSGRRPP
jgi:hypothetical protein